MSTNGKSKTGIKDSGTRRKWKSGAQRDAQENKGAFHLLPQLPLFLLSRIYEDGAKKYADRNWEKGMPVSVFVDSAERHLAKYKMGLRDEPHLSQALWNVVGALFMAVMCHLGLRDASFYDLPNHVGYKATEDLEVKDERLTDGTWASPPLSQHEITSLKNFGLDREEFKKKEK